jgi:hypothetical protein
MNLITKDAKKMVKIDVIRGENFFVYLQPQNKEKK